MAIHPDRVEGVFSAAVAIATPAERAAYLDDTCAGDGALRERVEALLASHDAADGFLPPAPHAQALPTVDHGPAHETAGTRIGRYKLLQLIGEGGFGAVYMAEQEHPVRRRVALKIIKPGMDTKQVIARFEAERQALAMMDHPNIARVLDAGATDAGRPFFVMELVNGIPITEYCDKNTLPTPERLGLFVSVCHAVQHAHHKGIIHRDIKPSNVLVTLHDGVPVPKVIDFGIAKATQSRLTEKTLFTEFRQMIGTPEYMSPEQAEMSGLDVDTRSDVYSLGVLLYELLTGTTPFDARELRSKAYAEIQRMIREVEPPKPSTRVSSLGGTLAAVAAHRRTEPRKLGQLMRGELDCIVMKAMEKDRTRRYETASGLAADLRRYLDHEPIVARPATAGYRLRKLTRKHKVGIAAGAAVVASLVAGLAGTTAGLLRARAERDRAVSLRHAAEVARDDANEAAAFIRDFSMESREPSSVIRRARDTGRRLDGGWLRDQPEAAAICRTVIGVAMIPAGALDDAERQLAAALELYRSADGRYRPGAATVLSYMGNIRFEKKDYAAAARHYQDALDVFGRLPDAPGNKEVTLANLTVVFDRLGRHDDIRKLRPEVVAARLHVLNEHIARDPTNLFPLTERANLYIAEGDFRAAAADCGTFLARRPGGSSELSFRHCALLLYAGDENAYRDAREAMLATFGRSDKIEDRERVAKAHFISPDPGAEADRLAAWVDEAANSGGHSFIAWFQMTKALAEYRAGHFRAAAEWCERAGGFPNLSAHATLQLLLAMSRHRAAAGPETRSQLDRAAAAAESLDRKQDAEHYALAKLLLREANAIRAAAADPAASNVATAAPAPPPATPPAARQ